MFAKITEKDYNLIKKLENGTTKERRFVEIFKIIIIDDDFKNMVLDVRKKMGIPLEGLDMNEEADREKILKCVKPGGIILGKYLSTHSLSLNKLCPGCNEHVKDFLEKKKNYGNAYDFDLSFPIREYILAGDFILAKTEMIAASRKLDNNEDWFNELNFNFYKNDSTKQLLIEDAVTLSFSPNVSKEELLDYIETNWKYIKKLKNNKREGNSNKRIKSKKNFFRDLYIYQKFEEIKNTVHHYPEIKVASFLKKEHDLILSEGSIRGIVSRMRKFVANKQG